MTSLSTQASGTLAMQLVQSLQRNPDIIPPYCHELMKACTNRMNELYQQNHADMNALNSQGSSRGTSSADYQQAVTAICGVRDTTIQWLKRSVMAYLHERAKRIRALRWKFGQIPPSVRPNLTESEVEFFNSYVNALAEFQMSFSEDPVDITESMYPPKDLFVQVRVLQDYGEFETSKGDCIILRRNTIHSLPSKDVESLIRQGVLEYCN